MNQTIKRLLGGVLLLMFSISMIPQEKGLILDEVSRRKFDYYYYAALSAKTQNKFGEAHDLFNHCFALDSTNSSLLVELAAFQNALNNLEGSYELVRKSVNYNPDNYYYNMVLADLSMGLDKYEEVVDIYNNMLELYPEKVELYFDLSNVYSSMGETDSAIASLDSLQKYTGDNDAIAVNKFRLYTAAGEKEKAFDEIEKIVTKSPDNPQYLLMVGELYLEDGDSEKAIDYFDRAKNIDPESPQLILSMVKYYDKTGDKEASESEIKKAITNVKMDVDTKLSMLGRYVGMLSQGKQSLEVADPLFESMFEQHPNNSNINLLYGEVLMFQKKEKEALVQYERYTNDNPTDITGYEQMLRILLPDTSAHDKIIELTEKGIEHIPDAPQFYYYLGMIKAIQEKYKESLQVFEDGLKNAEFRNPMIESDFYGQLGDINYMIKKESVAFEMYEKAIGINPQNTHVLNNYSYYLSLKRQDLDKAEKMSSLTVKAEPTNPTFLDTYGWILFEQGAYTMAKIYIEKAIEYSEDDISADVWEHYGDVLAVTGDEEGAVEQWKKARDAGGNSKILKKKIRKKRYLVK